MKKWKIVRSITGILILLFLLLILVIFISNYFSNVSYPYPMFGLDVYNWFDAFVLELTMYFYIFGIPLLIDIIIFIISIIKTRNMEEG